MKKVILNTFFVAILFFATTVWAEDFIPEMVTLEAKFLEVSHDDCEEFALYDIIKSGRTKTEVGLVARHNCGGCSEDTQDLAGVATLSVSILSKGKGSGGRNYRPAVPQLKINGQIIKPDYSELFWVEKPSSGSNFGTVVFTALGALSEGTSNEAVNNQGKACNSSDHQNQSQQTSSRSTTDEVLERGAMAAGLGLIASQAKGQITGRKTCYTLTRAGEPLVISGLLLTTKVENDVTNVPLMVKIPYVGRLFSSYEKKDDHKELLVFVTPKILKEAE